MTEAMNIHVSTAHNTVHEQLHY